MKKFDYKLEYTFSVPWEYVEEGVVLDYGDTDVKFEYPIEVIFDDYFNYLTEHPAFHYDLPSNEAGAIEDFLRALWDDGFFNDCLNDYDFVRFLQDYYRDEAYAEFKRLRERDL